MHRAFKYGARLVLISVFIYAQPHAAAQELQHTLTGEFRTHADFHSRYLASDRNILVYLPPGYDAKKKERYPVLYLHDGQNLFDGATSFIKGAEWRIDETAQTLIASRAIRPLIIVGIYNGKDRTDEYAPSFDARRKAGGKAAAYGRMIVEELKPFIDSEYRTLRDAKNTGLGGSSLGGLVSLYLALKYPKTFGRVAVVSPSVWWDNLAILREVGMVKKKPALRIWLDMGTKEGRDKSEWDEGTNNARKLRDALVAKGWKENSDLRYFEAEGAEHNERAWAARVEPMLRFLFPPK